MHVMLGAPPSIDDATWIVMSLMLGPTHEPLYRAVSSQVRSRMDRPCLWARAVASFERTMSAVRVMASAWRESVRWNRRWKNVDILAPHPTNEGAPDLV